MTSTIEYSYLSNGFSLRVNEAIMNRAVRVKVAVMDKIRRVFERNVIEISSAKQESVSSEPVVEKQSLVNLSEENLYSLNDKLNAMQSQKNVHCVVSRAVLFTKPLVTKIESVTAKWFAGMPVVVKSEEVATDESSFENVIPGTWDDVPENTFVDSNTVMGEEPKVEVNSMNESVSNDDMSVSENVVPTQDEQELSGDETNIPVENAVSDVSFMPNMDELVPSDVVSQSDDFVPEPELVSAVEETEFVPEPNSLVVEPTIASTDLEDTHVVAGEVEHVVNNEDSVSNELNNDSEEKSMSVEEKIAEIIQRKRANHTEEENPKVTVVAEEEPNEEEDKKVREELKPELTQAGVIARLQRLNNTMKDKDATIRSLTAKNETAKEEVLQARDKIRGYEAVVTDLTSRNESLVKENEKLTIKVQEAETASQATIAKLESQVAELTEAKNEEIEMSRKVISDLKEKHANEIASLKEKHAAELKAVSDSKEKQIQAIYATISEALGDPIPDDDYGYSKAA